MLAKVGLEIFVCKRGNDPQETDAADFAGRSAPKPLAIFPMRSLCVQFLVACIFGGLLSACSLPIPEPDVTLRPVNLTIIDGETGDPLPNIQVYQLFETDIYGGCWSLFMTMCPTDSSVWLNSAVSDKLGRVSFPEKTYDFTCDEYPQAEYLVINLDLIPEFHKKYETQFTKAKALHFYGLTPLNDFNNTVMTVNSRYRGRVIYGKSNAISDPLDMWQGAQGIFDVEVNLEGYSKPQQTIVVKLKRADSP